MQKYNPYLDINYKDRTSEIEALYQPTLKDIKLDPEMYAELVNDLLFHWVYGTRETPLMNMVKEQMVGDTKMADGGVMAKGGWVNGVTKNGIKYKYYEFNSPFGKYKYVIDGTTLGGYKFNYVTDEILTDEEIQDFFIDYNENYNQNADGGMMAKGGMTEMKIKGFSKKVPTFKSKVKGFDYKINKSVYDNFSDAQLTIAWYEFDLLVIGNIQFKVLETARYINDKFIDNNLPKADLLELSELITTYRDYYNEIYKKFKKFEDGGMMAKGGYDDFGYHKVNKEVTLKNGEKIYITKGRYYWSNELGDGRVSGIYYESKDGMISKDSIDKMALGGGVDGFKKGDKVVLKFDIEYRKGNEVVFEVVGFDNDKLILEQPNRGVNSRKVQMRSYVNPNDVVLKSKMGMGGVTYDDKEKSLIQSRTAKIWDEKYKGSDQEYYSDFDRTWKECEEQAIKELKKEKKLMALGGLFDSPQKRSANRGRSWTLDHRQHNKGQSYEIPLNKRKRKY